MCIKIQVKEDMLPFLIFSSSALIFAKLALLRDSTGVFYPQKTPSRVQPAAVKVNSFPFPRFDAALTGVTSDTLGSMKLGSISFRPPPEASSLQTSGAVISPRPVMWVTLS